MPNFAERVEVAVSALSTNPPKEVDENEFIDASRLVYDGVREIRRAVLMNRTDEELDPEDVELDEHNTVETRSKCEFIQLALTNCTDNFVFSEYPHWRRRTWTRG